MEERQRAENGRPTLMSSLDEMQALDGGELQDIGSDVPMSQHHSFGLSRRARWERDGQYCSAGVKWDFR